MGKLKLVYEKGKIRKFVGVLDILMGLLAAVFSIGLFTGTGARAVPTFILMSGIFTPYESMPKWAQDFNLINPVSYLMRINRMVMLKGSDIHDISRELYSLAVIAICFSSLAVSRYRKRA